MRKQSSLPSEPQSMNKLKNYQIKKKKIFFNIYFWEKGDTESEACSMLQYVSTEPDMGLELMNREIMTWAEVRCLTDWATSQESPDFWRLLHQ